MRSDLRPGLAIVLLLAVGPPVSSGGEVIERVLAVADDRPVLLSEVRVVELVRGLPRDKALDALIDERLMFDQAARLPQTAVSAADVDQAVAGLLAARPALAGQVTPADLVRLVRRQATILKFVDYRLRPQVRVSEDVPEEDREVEARRLLDERIEAWVKELREGAEIRYNPEAVRAPAGP